MMEPLQPGDPRVAGQFRLRARLGAGGMGRVFLGYSPAGRAVAVKICHPEFAADPEFVHRFALEVAAARAVNGLYTAQVIDAGPDDAPPWLATSYVPGPSLLDAVGRYGPLPEPAVWRLAAGLAEALAAVHARGLVHRDLKPTNVLLAPDGPRVIDFGVARALDGPLIASRALTATGVTFGTPSYMSPEQAQGRPIGPASDVFALGSTLCFAAAGGPPFGGGDPPAVLDRVVRAEPALDAVPGELCGLIAGCLAKDPAQRLDLPQILRACQARAPRPGAEGYGSASFWPAQVAAVIAAHQAGPDGVAPAREPYGEPTSGAGYRHALGTLHPATQRTGPEQAGREQAGREQAGREQAGREQAGRERPGSERSGRERAGPGPGALSRRRALAGLAAVSAAGLGAAGWALTRSDGAKPTAAGPPGRLLWARDTGGPVSSGAALSGGVVYIGGADGVHALDTASGRPVTKIYRTGGAVQGAVTIAGATLLAGCDDNLVYTWPIASGGSSWRHPTGGPVTGRPAVTGGTVYVGSDDHFVYALDARTGQLNWRYQTGGPVRSSPQRTLVTFNDYVYVGSDDGYLYALDTQERKRGWRFGTGGPVRSGPATVSGSVYAGNTRGDIYEVSYGPPVDAIWEYRAGGAILGKPVTDGAGTLYAASADGTVHALSLSGGGPIWAYRLGGPVRSGLALAGGILYVGSDDEYLYAINVTTGKPQWRYRAGGAIRSQVLVAGGAIYFGSLDHRVYALRA
jgi:outer membrane protein assembly factor BamB